VSATASRSRHVPARPDVVWAVLADFGGLARWASDVEHSCLLRDDELDVGLARRVQVGRSTLVETLEVLEPGRRLAYRIEGLPPVLRRVANEWVLEPSGEGTEVTLTTTVDAGARPPQRLIARLASVRFARASESMLAGLAGHLARGAPDA
jgi:carbon monoxide dehydrogenase subunit G